MQLYEERLTQLAIDLVNTVDPMTDSEYLGTVDDLVHFMMQHDFDANGVPREAELRQMRDVRKQLRDTIIGLERTRGETAAVEFINMLLRDKCWMPQVARRRGRPWEVTFSVKDDMSPVQRLTIEAALGLALALQHYGKHRLKVCAALPCREIFIDRARNHSRLYCSARCANRLHVAAFRARARH